MGGEMGGKERDGGIPSLSPSFLTPTPSPSFSPFPLLSPSISPFPLSPSFILPPSPSFFLPPPIPFLSGLQVTSSELFSQQLSCYASSGPTSAQQPAFQWSTSKNPSGTPQGHPDKWSFAPMLVKWT